MPQPLLTNIIPSLVIHKTHLVIFLAVKWILQPFLPEKQSGFRRLLNRDGL